MPPSLHLTSAAEGRRWLLTLSLYLISAPALPDICPCSLYLFPAPEPDRCLCLFRKCLSPLRGSHQPFSRFLKPLESIWDGSWAHLIEFRTSRNM
jgi:hypothetical protein